MHRPPKPGGFTLIEILVVMFIVSIMTGIAIANMPTFARTGEFETEARRLATLIRMVREEAVTQANEYGLRSSGDGYEFLVYDEAAQAWNPVDDRPFEPRSLPAGIHLELEVEENELALGGNDSEDAAAPPPVLLLSSGETTPFELTLSWPDEGLARTLVADGYNTARWAHAGENRAGGAPR